MATNTRKRGRGEQWDGEVEPLMKLLIGPDGVRTDQAAEVGKRAVEYFRGQDFCKWVTRNKESISTNTPIGKETFASQELPNAAISLGTALLQGGFIYRANYHPVDRSASGTDGDKAPKWPRRLGISTVQSFKDTGFYVIRYEGSKFGRHAMLAAIIAAVLVVCMWPAWPFMLRLAVWYILVVLMTIILAICAGRLVLFALLWFFGCDFWFMPNLFNDDVGIRDSFIPAYSFEYRNDSWLMVAARAFCAIIVAASIHQLGKTHSISDVHQFAARQFLDVLDWGHQKLAAAPTPDVGKFTPGGVDPLVRHRVTVSSSNKKGSKEDEFGAEEEKEDYTCLQKCGFSTIDELESECFSECGCMTELLATPCYRRCPAYTKKVLDEATETACSHQDDSADSYEVDDEDDEFGNEVEDDEL